MKIAYVGLDIPSGERVLGECGGRHKHLRVRCIVEQDQIVLGEHRFDLIAFESGHDLWRVDFEND